MSRPIPVTPERWGEMVLALSEVNRLQEENARLKAEVERLELKATNLYNAMKVKLEADEVVCKSRAIILQKEANDTAFNLVIKKLEAEVERLRKAGDAMKDAVETYFELMPMLVTEVRAKAMLKGRKAIKAWNAAKEGKPSV